LIMRQIIVELGVHVASADERDFGRFVPTTCERDATILSPDSDPCFSSNIHILLAKCAG
jgi:hypothetical protein